MSIVSSPYSYSDREVIPPSEELDISFGHNPNSKKSTSNINGDRWSYVPPDESENVGVHTPETGNSSSWIKGGRWSYIPVQRSWPLISSRGLVISGDEVGASKVVVSSWWSLGFLEPLVLDDCSILAQIARFRLPRFLMWACQWFLMSLSVLPGKFAAIADHLDQSTQQSYSIS